MSFPLSLGPHRWEDGPALLAAVSEDARAGGGSVVAAERPSQWLPSLVRSGALDASMAVGLVAALLKSSDDPAVLAEAARIALALEHPALGDMLVACIEVYDTGLLLAHDPLGEASSVEDVLLEAAVRLANLDEASVRGSLLPRLRNAGLASLELTTLVGHGSVDELRQDLPGVLVEALPPGGAARIADRLQADPDAQEAILEVLWAGPDAPRSEVMTALLARKGGRALGLRLIPTQAAEA